MFLENIIPPIPSEIIMPLGGFFVYQQKLNFYILVFWGLFGTILVSLPWFYLGRLVNEKRLSNFLDEKGKYLGISSNDLNNFQLVDNFHQINNLHKLEALPISNSQM